MKQSDTGLNLTTKRMRKRELLARWSTSCRGRCWSSGSSYVPESKKGRPPFAVEIMPRIHFMQQWFTLSDPGMEEAFHDVSLFREFASLS